MSARLLILETTLRGYKRSPVEVMSPREKLVVARQLEKLGVDAIEAGFPARSLGDEEGVGLIAREIKATRVVARARAVLEDIESAWIAVEHANLPGIHTFIPTSDILLKRRVNMPREQVIEYTARAVSMARSLSDWVQFSCEDATRTDIRFICEVIQTAVDAGAGTVNLIDSRGYAYPGQLARLVKEVRSTVAENDNVIISVNCHDHLGLAVANSVAAARAGARQVECAVNGTGERAGNAALEQIATILDIRQKAFRLETGIVFEQIHQASRLISTITGIPVQPNKALMRATAMAYPSPEHADGSEDHETGHETPGPVSAGIGHSEPSVPEDSGRHSFEQRINALGYQLTPPEINLTFTRFKELAGNKETVYDEDIEAIIAEEVLRNAEKYKLISVTVMSGSDVVPTARVWMEIDGKKCHGAELGNGPVDATFNAICKLTGRMPKLLDFSITSITGGADALGRAMIRVEEGGSLALGQGSHEDVLVASARAMVNALNRLDFVARKREVTLQL